MKLLNEILGTKYPIIQGGMANIATGEFAAACSNAGALGLIGSGGMDADALRENIRHCRALTDQPFGVNIMLMHPQAAEMAKIAAEHGVKYIVFSSTAATYGEPERVPILETDPTHPTNCYGDTKLAMERMFYWASVAHGIHFVALRYFNACGAHPNGNIGEAHDPETHLIPIVLQVPNGQRKTVNIFGDDYGTRDGTCVRDYIHVCDLASAHVLAAEYLMNGGKNDVFNLGNGVGFTVREIVDAAEKVVGKPIACEIASRRAGDPAQLVASSEKAKTVLGWKPKYDDIDTIISTAWRWHSTHPCGYKA